MLVVDDDADIRQLMVELLRMSGFEATGASGGVDALQTLRDPSVEAFDLVVLDVHMPDLDGWETLRRLRAHPQTTTMRVVMCTVKAGEDDVARGFELGCDGYLAKPFAIGDLLAEVRRVLETPSGVDRPGL